MRRAYQATPWGHAANVFYDKGGDMGARYDKDGCWGQLAGRTEVQAAQVGMAAEIRRPTISDALETAAKKLEGLHAAITEVEQRTEGFCVPAAAPPDVSDTTKPAGLSQVHMAIMDINASLDDAMARLNAIARTIDL